MPNIHYSAVVLTDKSKERIIKQFAKQIPDDYNIVVDHMLINDGEIRPDLKKFLDMPIGLSINKLGICEGFVVLDVSGFESNLDKPYILLAKNNNSSFNTNRIEWQKLKKPMYVSGIVKEVEFNVL